MLLSCDASHEEQRQVHAFCSKDHTRACAMGKRSPQRAQTLHTLEVVTTKMTLLGKGTKRTRVVHAIVLYQQGLRMPIGMSRGACGSATSRPGRCRHVLL
jgi:hypothetical protein